MLFDRRSVLVYSAELGAALFVGTAFTGCTSTGGVDPAKVAETIKTTCGIAVILAGIADVIKADPSLNISQIVDLVCSAYKTQMATKLQAGEKLAAGSKVNIVVVVNGKEVPIEATVP